MKNKLPALLMVCALAWGGTASALQNDQLVAVTEMPLAVAEVVAQPDVPRDDVITVVHTLNQAAVPAPQFVEIVRYVPVALVERTEPRFVTYVTQEHDRGLTGEPLALAITNRYRPVEFDPLALIAMPLAVAAVADLTGVPSNELMQFVSSLNQARVPAPQFVEVVRYAPVVLVDRTEAPRFIQFVSTEVDRGVIGRPLAYSIAERIETFEPIDIDVVQPRTDLIVTGEPIVPPVVVARVTSGHPHGGPPGRLKKERGLQTGAEVVHGTKRNRVEREVELEAVRPNGDRIERRQRVAPEPPMRQAHVSAPPAKQHGGGHGNGHGTEKGHGNGKGGSQGHGNSEGGKGKGKGKG